MTFLLRTLSVTADGREIVRDRRIEKPQIGIGRAAERDIHLTDLAVDADHARVEQLDSRRIVVRSVGTLGFTVDGRQTTRVEIDSAAGAELGFGGHRITVGREDAADGTASIVLTVRREGALSDAAGDKDEAAVFSLREKMPSKRTLAWILSILVLALFLAVPVVSFATRATGDDRRIDQVVGDKAWSPGKLSDAHHGLEENCEACHVKAFVSVRDETCKSCHADAHDHAPPERLGKARAEPGIGGRFLNGVAAAFGKEGPGSCVDCHSEHEGEGRMAATPQAFCSDCHGTLKARLPDTALGNAADFGTIHPQFRPLVATKPGLPGMLPTFERVSLDLKPKDRNGLRFPHDMHLSRTNGVARMAQTMKAEFGFGDALACKDCHRTTADGVRFLPVDMEQDCQMCHSLAFDRVGGTVRTLRHGDPDQVVADLRAFYRDTSATAPMELGGMARRRPGAYAERGVYGAWFGASAARPGRADQAIAKVFSPDGACGECHVTSRAAGGGWQVAPVHQTARFLQKGWFSHAAHRTETCESCHAAGKSKSASDLMIPDLASCRTCHGGEISNAKVATGCALCHNYHADDGAPWLVRRGGSDRAGTGGTAETLNVTTR